MGVTKSIEARTGNKKMGNCLNPLLPCKEVSKPNFRLPPPLIQKGSEFEVHNGNVDCAERL